MSAVLSNLAELGLVLVLAALAPFLAVGTAMVYLVCLVLTIADNISLGLRPLYGLLRGHPSHRKGHN